MRRTTTALAFALAGLIVLGCSDSSGPARPPVDEPEPPAPPAPPPPPAPDLEGWATYALTLNNRLVVFGSENPSDIAMDAPIAGLPFGKRIVGIAFHPSNGKLYGVGNDSRVYTIDRGTGAATVVGSAPFQPSIFQFFDVHFAMGFDPATERIRLISAESGTNWSIDPDDGTAIRGDNVQYADGDENEGHRPAIAGLAYTGANGTAGARVMRKRVASSKATDLCEELMWAIDADLAELIGSCNPDEADFVSIAPIPVFGLAACAEITFDPGENLWATMHWRPEEGVELRSSLFHIDPETSEVSFIADLTIESPVQSIAFDPLVPFNAAPRPGSAAPRQTMAARRVAQLVDSSVREDGASCTPASEGASGR